MRVAVTGANGFVGRAVVASLVAHGHHVRALTRSPALELMAPGVETVATGLIEKIVDWRSFLDRMDAVVHLAARAHVPDSAFADDSLVRAINTDATLRLAEDSARRGIRRFLFLSSIKVHGEATKPWQPFRAADPLRPEDAYGRAKAAAEEGLAVIAARTGLAVTVLRPPLVYGPGARANLAALMRLIAVAPVLPFGAVANRRSLISLGNLASAIVTALDHPAAEGKSFVLADGEDVSTTDLVRRLAKAMDRKLWLAPVPVPLLRAGARIVGREAVARRLTDWLQVDPGDFVATLRWRPVERLDDGLAAMVRARAVTASDRA